MNRMQVMRKKVLYEGNYRGPMAIDDDMSIDSLVVLAREAGIPATSRWKRETIIEKLEAQK